MATNCTALVENIITCPVCLKHLDQPRMLPCSHTFCFPCIQQMTSQNKGLLECPKGDGIKIEGNNIDAPPLNQAVREFVQLLGERSDSYSCQAFLNCQLENLKETTVDFGHSNFCPHKSRLKVTEF